MDIDIEKKLADAAAENKRLLDEIKSKQDRHGQDIGEIITELARLKIPRIKCDDPATGGRSSPEFKAYDKFVRKGEKALGPEELKALTVADNPEAGYLAPAQISGEIIKGIVEFSPMRQVARVVQITRESLEIPKKTGSGSAYWVSEIGTRAEVTGLKYGREKLIPYEMAYLAKASLKQLEDSAYDVEAELNQEFAEQFGVLESEAFVNGTGAEQPEGLLTNASVPTYISEDADDITADSILALPFQIKSGYLPGARYLLNRTSLWKIRTFRDPVSTAYLWQPAMGDATPATICGFPYTLVPELDDPDTDKVPVLFGNFNRGYMIVDRVTMAVQRLSEKYAEAGEVGFLARRRVGGQVVLPEAIIKLKCATSA